MMKIGIFGGTFDPVHSEHVALASAAIDALSLDRLFVVPTFLSPHKQGRRVASAEHRLAMCRLAFSQEKEEVCDYEIEAGGTSYSYLTCRHFRALYPDAEIYFVMGTDMLDFFPHWKEPRDILSHVRLAVGARAEELTALEGRQSAFSERFGCGFSVVPFVGAPVSSTKIRAIAALGGDVSALTGEKVAAYLEAEGVYRDEMLCRALALEKPSRREHSIRVAVMALSRAESLGIPEETALLAAGMHDVAKNLPPDSPYLAGFVPPDCPPPVLHQFSGAYVAEHAFGVRDEDVLNAIRYHTSGRPHMSDLEKLVFLADMLEEGRSYPGVEECRQLFYRDIDACLALCLKRQLAYLRECGGTVYPLTEQTYQWIKEERI